MLGMQREKKVGDEGEVMVFAAYYILNKCKK